MASLKYYEKQANKSYKSPYTKQLKKLTNQVLNPTSYEWDANKDTAYQTVRDTILRDSASNARNLMAQSAANSLGYGNTYGAAVAGAAYRKGIESLADAATAAEQNAYQRYLQTLSDNQNKLSLLQNLESLNYGKHQDTISQAQANRNYAYTKQQDKRNFDYQKQLDKRNFEYQKQQDEYQRALSLIKASNSSKKSSKNDDIEIPKNLKSKLSSSRLTAAEKIQAIYDTYPKNQALAKAIIAEYIGEQAVEDYSKIGPFTPDYYEYMKRVYGK